MYKLLYNENVQLESNVAEIRKLGVVVKHTLRGGSGGDRFKSYQFRQKRKSLKSINQEKVV